MAFVQPVVKIDKEKEFEELKGLVSHALAPKEMESFLKKAGKKGVRVRQVEAAFENGIFDRKNAGTTALSLYQALTVSDQAQMREFYLSKIEEIEPKLRHKFRKLYQYY
ncbi:MAG: hypothetical protein ACRD2U_09430 [Terriglobales bacterium]